LGQLDVVIREHKQEMERKVESLQLSIEARERELRDTQRELSDRNMKHHCEALTRELDATKLQNKEKEVRLCGVEEELALKESRWLQTEARLQGMVTSLEQELELEREQHSRELESLQQTRGQLLKVSEQISSTMRSSQEQLTTKLQQCQTQLEQTKALLDQTKTELDRTQNQASHLQTQLDQSQSQLLQSKSQLEQSRILYEQTRTQNSDLRAQLEQLSAQLNQARGQAAQLRTELQACEKTMETSNESILIKESEVTRLQARISNEVDHSWQGLSAMEATVASDHSFNPLTYMVDKQDDGHPNMEATSIKEGHGEQLSESRRDSACTLVGEEREADMSSLTGMLSLAPQRDVKEM
ncbi:coiled-coil domain-containing protein 18 isoform X1, partial [Lates japonicus]